MTTLSSETDGTPRCARHPEATATETCSRCGDYACAECLHAPGGSTWLCASCLARAREQREANGLAERRCRGAAGAIYFVGFLWFGTAGLLGLLIYSKGPTSTLLAALTVLLVLGIAAFWTGRQIDQLLPRGRVPGFIVAALLLPGFPLGTLLGTTIIISLARHGHVLSTNYREVVALTPDLDAHRMPVWQKVVIASLLTAIVGVFAWIAVGG